MILASYVFAAGLDEILPAVIVVIIMVVSVVAQLLGKLREANPGQAKPPSEKAPPVGRLMDEISEYLRRAKEAGQQEQQRQTEPNRPRQQGQSSQQGQPQRQKPAARPVEPVIVAETVPGPARGRQSLGAAIAQEDAATDARLKQLFDHKIGSLEAKPADSADLAATAALIQTEKVDVSALVAMLTDPDGVRNALVLGEILARPEHRWA